MEWNKDERTQFQCDLKTNLCVFTFLVSKSYWAFPLFHWLILGHTECGWLAKQFWQKRDGCSCRRRKCISEKVSVVKLNNTQLQQTNVTRRGRSVDEELRGKREDTWKIKWEMAGGGRMRKEKIRGGRKGEKGASGGDALELLLDFSDSPRTGLQVSFDLLFYLL